MRRAACGAYRLEGYCAQPERCRQQDQSCVDFLTGLCATPRELASVTTDLRGLTWLVGGVRLDRVLALHALPEDVAFEGQCLSCMNLDASGCGRHLGGVTGFDLEIVRYLLLQHELYAVLREAIVLIEGTELPVLGLRCRGGNHRSVAVAYLLLLLAYPMGSVHCYTQRATAAATQYLQRQRHYSLGWPQPPGPPRLGRL